MRCGCGFVLKKKTFARMIGFCIRPESTMKLYKLSYRVIRQVLCKDSWLLFSCNKFRYYVYRLRDRVIF